jgi:hypothetical protein
VEGGIVDAAFSNTYGGDTYSSNIYLVNGLPPISLGGSFLNSGNLTTVPTRIMIDLSTPGIYSFTGFADTSGGDVSVFDHWGLNLFFGGDDVHPGISVFGQPNLIGPDNHPAFAPNLNAVTATLDPPTMGNTPGAGSLSFSDGSTIITLSDYRLSGASVFGVDRVSQFDLGANGVSDAIVEFTLSVTSVPVPEPSSLISAALGLAALAGYVVGRGL